MVQIKCCGRSRYLMKHLRRNDEEDVALHKLHIHGEAFL